MMLLLKTKSTPTDIYEEYFDKLEGGIYEPQFIPVLQHHFVEDSLRWLQSTVEDGGFSAILRDDSATTKLRFGGIIFTSQRAVEAFAEVLKSFGEAQRDRLLPRDVTLFVVGPATAKAVRALSLQCLVIGEDTGNGDALADFILDQYKTPTGADGQRLPLLFLVGEQRRDIIPRKLQHQGLELQSRITVFEKTVYSTGEKEDFGLELERVLQHQTPSTTETWVVVFSPSGCRAMLQTLGWLNDEGRYDMHMARSNSPGTYVATIGPTTRDYLLDQFGFHAHVCADTPSPEGIGNGMKCYIEAQR